MSDTLTIGDFSRATQMSVKTLRHYHRVGLLEPADVDPNSGYRRYSTEQIPAAQVVRRFRQLEMPLDEIRAVLAAPDPAARSQLIGDHLGRLERELEQTAAAVASLRELLSEPGRESPIEHRTVPEVPAAAITATVEVEDALDWLHGALGELYASLDAQGLAPSGPAGGVYSNDLFTEARGQATVFVPTAGDIRPVGRLEPLVVPGVELAVATHAGRLAEIDRAYGSLAKYVAQHALGIDGSIREYYVVGVHETSDQERWVTEIGWPIFQTTAA
jgi:DNA-binding transcriptional MerR regulator